MMFEAVAMCALALGVAIGIICSVYSGSIRPIWFTVNKLLPELQVLSMDIAFNSTGKLEHAALPTYPIEWWTDEKIYQLECRAIFSKQWLFVSHFSRFQKPGDYRTFEVSGFSFLLTMGKDRQLRAFHNVCRHRAYAVTKKECGRSIVLGCRYHGWSYDTKGKLIKAPEFETVPGFDKNANSLWEVALKVRQSLIFVNLDAAIPTQDVDLGQGEVILARWGISDMQCISDWKFEAAFNWKLLGALKNESCNNAVPAWIDLVSFWTPRRTNDVQLVHTTLVRNLASGRILTMKATPKSAKRSLVECSIFSTTPKNRRQLEEVKTGVYHDIERLESIQQRVSLGQEPLSSLASSIATSNAINLVLKEHLQAEAAAGSLINPAARTQSFEPEGKGDDDFCRELDNPKSICGANAKGLLEW